MMIKLKYLLPAFLLILLLPACKKNTIQIDYKYSYFPLEIGHTLIYELDSILYSPLYINGRDTVHWELKEVVESKFIDVEGRDAFRLIVISVRIQVKIGKSGRFGMPSSVKLMWKGWKIISALSG